MKSSNRRAGPVWLAGGGPPAFVALLVLVACGSASSGPPSTEPYVLFAPVQSDSTYLMDLQGQLVHEWRSPSSPACPSTC